ncbi:hypothetical protein Peur_014256 [Populus x canadensis]
MKHGKTDLHSLEQAQMEGAKTSSCLLNDRSSSDCLIDEFDAIARVRNASERGTSPQVKFERKACMDNLQVVAKASDNLQVVANMMLRIQALSSARENSDNNSHADLKSS